MKKFTLLLAAAMLSVASFAADTLVKELNTNTVKGKDNGYATAEDVVADGITWNATGNLTVQPWRIGGRSLTNQDRNVFTKTAITDDISKIEVSHGTSTVTMNSFKLLVASNADFSDAVEYPGEFKASETTTFTRPADANWANKYYKFVYNVTVSGTSNKYFQLVGVKFYKEIADIVATGIELDQTALTLEQYKRATLTATLTPAEANVAVTWTSSDDAVATVKDGVVMATGLGTATITATAGEGVSATCDVTVNSATAITCAEAKEIALAVSANNDVAEGGMYVIRGYVTEVFSNAESNLAEYGNYSFWMADTKGGANVFEGYQVTPVDGAYITAVGDYVEVIGDLTKYGTTPETVAKTATVKKLADPATAIENATVAEKAVKMIEDGQLVIIREGVKYNAQGAVVE
ncbi:MAG: Ig domain-containing protein [Paludibacteraceae bacterium]